MPSADLAALSIILPVLNEAGTLQDTLTRLAPLCAQGAEVLVVDGGSSDRTIEIAQAAGVHTRPSARGRAVQMNTGAAAARGELLLFLHADTHFTRDAEGMLADLMKAHASGQAGWGRFDIRLSSPRWPFRIIEAMVNLRSRLSGVATGDQAIFVSRTLFHEAGGFPEIALMEDVALSKKLRRCSRPRCLRAYVITDARRWEQQGIVRTVILMWVLRAAFALGVSPERLARWYRHVR